MIFLTIATWIAVIILGGGAIVVFGAYVRETRSHRAVIGGRRPGLSM